MQEADRDKRERTRGADRPSENGKRRFPVVPLVVAAVLLTVLLVALGRFCSVAATIDVTVNGNALSLHGAKTLDTAMRESGWPVNPGDLISLDGSIIKRSAGNPFYATVNGKETLDRDLPLSDGDEIVLSDGTDIVEDYDSEEETIPCGAQVLGAGALCTFAEGTPKVVQHLTGRLSGAEVDRVTQPEEPLTAQWYNPDVGNDKVIALTFDRGPSVAYTNQILNVLEEYGVKATFFCEGKNVEANPSLVQRELSEGHQVASNTYSCSIDEFSTAEQVREEVQKGLQAVDGAVAGFAQEQQKQQEESTQGGLFGWFAQGKGDSGNEQSGQSSQQKRIIRFPNALLTVDMVSVTADNVDAVVGWNLDPADWMTADPATVSDVIMQAEPGDIVVLHDGDHDCSATAEALRIAIPKLKEQGFSFVTIDELMAYPAKDNA